MKLDAVWYHLLVSHLSCAILYLSMTMLDAVKIKINLDDIFVMKWFYISLFIVIDSERECWLMFSITSSLIIHQECLTFDGERLFSSMKMNTRKFFVSSVLMRKSISWHQEKDDISSIATMSLMRMTEGLLNEMCGCEFEMNVGMIVYLMCMLNIWMEINCALMLCLTRSYLIV